MAADAPGARFRAARQRAGLTQTEAAVRLGIAQTTLSQLERGVAPATLDRLHDYATRLGIDPHEVDDRLRSAR